MRSRKLSRGKFSVTRNSRKNRRQPMLNNRKIQKRKIRRGGYNKTLKKNQRYKKTRKQQGGAIKDTPDPFTIINTGANVKYNYNYRLFEGDLETAKSKVEKKLNQIRGIGIVIDIFFRWRTSTQYFISICLKPTSDSGFGEIFHLELESVPGDSSQFNFKYSNDINRPSDVFSSVSTLLKTANNGKKKFLKDKTKRFTFLDLGDVTDYSLVMTSRESPRRITPRLFLGDPKNYTGQLNTTGDEMDSGQFGDLTTFKQVTQKAGWVIKQIKKQNTEKDYELAQDLFNEFEIHKKLEYKNIVKLIYIYKPVTFDIGLILEQSMTNMESISNQKCVNKINNIRKYVDYFINIVDGLLYLHGEKIVHRDLAPRNVFICEGDVAKIGNFGLSESLNMESGTGMPVFKSNPNDRPLPMNIYPPELVNDFKQNKDLKFYTQTDVWSMGMLMFSVMYNYSLNSADWKTFCNNLIVTNNVFDQNTVIDYIMEKAQSSDCDKLNDQQTEILTNFFENAIKPCWRIFKERTYLDKLKKALERLKAGKLSTPAPEPTPEQAQRREAFPNSVYNDLPAQRREAFPNSVYETVKASTQDSNYLEIYPSSTEFDYLKLLTVGCNCTKQLPDYTQ